MPVKAKVRFDRKLTNGLIKTTGHIRRKSGMMPSYPIPSHSKELIEFAAIILPERNNGIQLFNIKLAVEEFNYRERGESRVCREQ